MAMSHSVCASQPQGRRIWVIRLLSRTQPDASVFRLIEEHTTAFRPGEEFHAPKRSQRVPEDRRGARRSVAYHQRFVLS